MKFKILTLFPEIFEFFKDYSVVGRGIQEGLASLDIINIRDYSENKHRKVDDYSYGGGPGMLMAPGPIVRALEANTSQKSHVIYLSPKGQLLNQAKLNSLKDYEEITLINGHYEGIDQRVIDHYVDEEISIGDYVLSGGEMASLVLMDGLIRLLPGVLSNEESPVDESHSAKLLEYPQYTRPQNFRGHEVPEVLLSGDHEKIRTYRRQMAIKETLEKRPDLLKEIDFSQEEIDFIKKLEENI
ncbi:MAG: tRNA (guanosine(37)-N1)-methyltransferase TrmD [Tissierellia bacterium]|nr:tRNA (guanosine(37)-N1)-methyltransferase TrmD [Tissierellia bacterium]